MRIDARNWREFARERVQSADWTVIIPAAGKGTRLGHDRPKVLYPVGGKSILDWLLERFEPLTLETVLVVSPGGRAILEEELERRGKPVRLAVQEEPVGMGDAVEVGLREVRTPRVAVVWGDQVALRKVTVEAVMRLHEGKLEPVATFPLVERDEPYIHFERNEEGRITGLRQRRENDEMPARGDSDTGFFCFQTEALRELLEEERRMGGRGAGTGEFNFLPVLVRAAARYPLVLTPQIMTMEETVGINTPAEAAQVAEFLRSERYASDEILA
jgi:bifunctional N-acetylglucosamine-1-phosphate-uridyltransferase/glucosamine-1-phosphate-acetyltransferase GlmU-like protein